MYLPHVHLTYSFVIYILGRKVLQMIQGSSRMLDSEEGFQFLKANIISQMQDIRIVNLFLHHIGALDITLKSNIMSVRMLAYRFVLEPTSHALKPCGPYEPYSSRSHKPNAQAYTLSYQY
jgi:hypothetical protein